ncbi:ROK family transcriptional regulator [Microbacterium sp. 179-I 3D4 NHS]|uniref:ROK family transcriptional regulator n=1 Tax=Microbacterium sp. 179-I 3D4 NHS TaxID=3142381 RepID=UPI0039A1B279
MGIRRGTNLPRMGDFNQSVIVEAIRRSPAGLSRTELAEATGLSAQTVTNITRRLLDEELIAEAGRRITGPGKPRTILRLVAESRFSVGVHLDPALITVVLLDLAGAVVRRTTAQTPEGQPDAAIEAMAGLVGEVVDASDVDPRRIAGVGVAAPGPVDADGGSVVAPPLLPGWQRVQLRERLAEATGFPVALEKDTAAAAVGELWTGRGPADDSFVFLYLGTGIGAALALDGDVIRGRTRNLGEIGHIVVDPEGAPCGCGSRGCVAVTCTPEAIVRSAIRAGVLSDQARGSSEIRANEARFAQLCAKVEAADAAAVEVMRRAAGHTAVLVADLSNLLDVDRVVLGGPFWSPLSATYLEVIPPLVERASATRALRSVPVVGTVVGDDVGAVGAACVVLDGILTPRASTLLLREADEPPAETD